MSMISEADFTAAMTRAVEKRGGTWRYPRASEGRSARRMYYPNDVPVYSTPGGEAACLIGAAMQEAGLGVPGPYENRSAIAVLDGKVPMGAILAARAGQIHQDNGMPWAECLQVYRVALRLQAETHATRHDATFLYYAAVSEVHGIKSPMVAGGMVWGQIVAPQPITVTFTAPVIPKSLALDLLLGSPILAEAKEPVLTKSDHALIA